jgi:Protein of unknown function, DUF484.
MKDKPQVPALQPDESPSESLEAAAIAAYLEAHPDFFVEHEDLLATLRFRTSAATPFRWSNAR